jgi:hypothetical protein
MFFLKILAELFGLMTTIYSFISFNYYSKFRYVENTNPTEEELDLYEKAGENFVWFSILHMGIFFILDITSFILRVIYVFKY